MRGKRATMMAAAMMLAGLDGIQNKIHPGDPADKDLYDLDVVAVLGLHVRRLVVRREDVDLEQGGRRVLGRAGGRRSRGRRRFGLARRRQRRFLGLARLVGLLRPGRSGQGERG